MTTVAWQPVVESRQDRRRRRRREKALSARLRAAERRGVAMTSREQVFVFEHGSVGHMARTDPKRGWSDPGFTWCGRWLWTVYPGEYGGSYGAEYDGADGEWWPIGHFGTPVCRACLRARRADQQRVK